MRNLKFKVDGQIITNNDDLSDLIPGSAGYLYANFEFSNEWKGLAKIASFWVGIQEHAVVLNNNRCLIPIEASGRKYFKVQVTGVKGDVLIPTNKIIVTQGR